MKILVTGATGIIGTQLCAFLLQKGISVNYLTTSKITKSEANFQGFHWNPQHGKIDENCMLNVDAVIHLAGASISKRWTETYKQEIIESRIVSANLLFKLLKANPHQVRHFVSASAIGIYPDSLTKYYAENEIAVDPSFLGNVVAKWEESVDKFRLLGITVCKIRTGLVLSEKGGMLREVLKPIRFGLGSAFGSGRQWQSWIHIDDITRMYFFAIENMLDGIYNGVAPNPVTNQQFVKAVALKLRKAIFLPNIPKFFIKFILGEMHLLLFTSQKVSSRKIQDSGFHFQYETLDTALDNLLP